LGGCEFIGVTVLETGPWFTPTILANDCQLALSSGSFLFSASGEKQAVDQSNANITIRESAMRMSAFSKVVEQLPAISQRQMNIDARFETTFTDVLNHAKFASPVTAIDNSQFGQLTPPQTAVRGGNVTGQAALRAEF
jgi:hypothetical protein